MSTEFAPETREKVDISDIRPHDPTWVTMNKYKMKRFPGAKITLPQGVNVEASRYANVRPPGSDASYFLATPEKMLISPRPGRRYVWRIRADDETIGLVETQEIRPVRIDEIVRDRRTAKILPWKGPEGHTYVGWKRFALFEVSPTFAYEYFDQPEDYAIAKLAHLGPDFKQSIAQETKGKAEGTFEAKDFKKASHEPRGGAPTRP